MQNRLLFALFAIFLTFTLLNGDKTDCQAAEGPPLEGSVLPEMKLPVPKRFEDRQYLQLKEGDSFKIPQIQSDVILVEIFSMYCPYCQKEAPVVNDLFKILEGRADLNGKIKIIGIGAGNSPFEVKAYRDLYRVAFPLFPDADFSLHKALGEVRTPYFLGIRIYPDGSHKVIYSQVGSFGDPQQFLELILNKSGLKERKQS